MVIRYVQFLLFRLILNFIKRKKGAAGGARDYPLRSTRKADRGVFQSAPLRIDQIS